MKKQITTIFLISFILLVSFSVSLFSQEYNKDLYAKRRRNLMEGIKEGVVIFRNSQPAHRSADEDYAPYRTNSDFYYLTGFDEPSALFILLPDEDKKFIMFVMPQNAMSSQWFGDVPGIDGAMKIYGADTAYSFRDFNKVIGKYLTGKKKVYLDFGNREFRNIINTEIDKTKDGISKEQIDIARVIHEMRIIKDAEEIKLIRKSVDITCNAHIEALKAIEPGMYEYEIAAIYSYIFEKEGAADKAFPAIAASGPNATIYHYSSNRRQTKAGDLVMLDMGAEYQKYSSDVTRVFPVNGKFTREQKEIYELVLVMEDAVIKHMKPGNKFGDCLQKAENLAKEGLFKLGLIIDKNSKWQHLLYYYPFICHGVGLDVHDVGIIGENTELKPNMVFALEPLIYVGENLIESFKLQTERGLSIPLAEIESFLNTIKPAFDKYKEIAARIEDDILITGNGNEILSLKVPRNVNDIEKMMAEKSYLNKK